MENEKESEKLKKPVSKKKLVLILALLIPVIVFEGYSFIKNHLNDTTVKSTAELQSALNDTAWTRKDDEGNVELLFFSRFMDVYSSTIDKDEKPIYNMPSTYALKDHKHINVSTMDGFRSRFDGEHEVLLKDDKTLVVDGTEYKKEPDSTYWFKLIYYD